MKSIRLFGLIALLFIYGRCKERRSNNISAERIATGQMPNLAIDKSERSHLVYGIGDSIMYAFSKDQGNAFSSPVLVATLPKLAASHTRGPQISATEKGLVVVASNSMGDIFSYIMDENGKWSQTSRVNDVDTVAKEGLMALSADGKNAFAVWLDLRDKHNKIYAAKSSDLGKSWSKNMLIYASPDSTVCECCKPSVVMRGNDVYIMFRNWLNGNRDLYLVHSSDGGNSFGQAQKLGNGSWALKGCPMDGGGLVINNNGGAETVWRRENKIYACEPGKPEKEIGEGKSCTMVSLEGKNVYAWTEKGEVVCILPNGEKVLLGKGILPVLTAINDKKIICIWENEMEIRRSVLRIL